jgi:peptidoglycan/LPS O-acetylase OafA/YrhL
MTFGPRTLNLPRKFSADKLGMWTSALCVVHCILTPVLLSMSSVFAYLIPGEQRTHRTFAILVAALGAIALIQGFRTHGRRRILVLMALGLGFIFCGAYFSDRLPVHSYEVAITLAGSVLMITAHRMNHTFCRDCHTCTDPH